MPQFISPALGLVGLVSQYNANQEANNEAKQQLAQQQALEQQQVAAYNNYMGQVGRLQQQGAFNPAARMQLLNQNEGYDLGNALSSEAGAARALGYRPGDSVPINEMNQTQGNFQVQEQQLANNILNQANANYLAALQGAPSLSDLGSGIEASGQNARMFEGMQEGMGGMLGALGPYLKGLTAGPSAGTNNGVQQSYANQVNSGGYDNLGNINLGNWNWMPSSGANAALGYTSIGGAAPPSAAPFPSVSQDSGLRTQDSVPPFPSTAKSSTQPALFPGQLDATQQAIEGSGGNPNLVATSGSAPNAEGRRPNTIPGSLFPSSGLNTQGSGPGSPYGLFGPPPAPNPQYRTPNANPAYIPRPNFHMPQPVFNA